MKSRPPIHIHKVKWKNDLTLQYSVHEPGRHFKRDLHLIFPHANFDGFLVIPCFWHTMNDMLMFNTEIQNERDYLLKLVLLLLLYI
jgi:hypothetical protein